MLDLNDKQIAEYCHRSYTAADGLWFIKVEEQFGFDAALKIDGEVWKVLPKIQARKLRSMGKTGSGMEALLECFTTKLKLDGFTFTTERIDNNSGFRVVIEKCPWYNLMTKSGREHLAEKVGTLICGTEYAVWASEFGNKISFELQQQICGGSEHCILQFSQ